VPVNSVPVSNPAAASPAAGRNTPSNAGEPLSVPQQPQRASDPVQAPARRPQRRPEQNSQQRGARTAAAGEPATPSGATPADPGTAPATPSSAGAAAAPSSPGASFGQTLAASLSGTTRKAGQTTPPGAKSKLTGTGQVDPQALAAAAALLRQLPTDASAPTEPTSTSTAAAPSATSPAGAPASDANALAAATAPLGQTAALGNANSELTPSASQDARPPTAAATLAKADPAVPASGDPATSPVLIAPLVAAAQTNAAHPAGADALPAAAALTYDLSAQTIAADAAATPNSASPADCAGSAPDLVALSDHANAVQLLDVLTANASGARSDPLAVTDPSAGAAPDATDPGSASSAAGAPFGAAPQSASATHTQGGAVEGPPLRSQIGTSAWTDELGARLTLMAHQGLASASLRLTPDHLGPVEVKISVRDSSASVWFGASQADTRAALEQALPRLRELFAAQGLNLTNAGVAGESPRGAPHSPRTTVAAPGDAAREAAVISVTSATVAHQGLIDTYA
jgi:flagellar hook-length control protein FliK